MPCTLFQADPCCRWAVLTIREAEREEDRPVSVILPSLLADPHHQVRMLVAMSLERYDKAVKLAHYTHSLCSLFYCDALCLGYFWTWDPSTETRERCCRTNKQLLRTFTWKLKRAWHLWYDNFIGPITPLFCLCFICWCYQIQKSSSTDDEQDEIFNRKATLLKSLSVVLCCSPVCEKQTLFALFQSYKENNIEEHLIKKVKYQKCFVYHFKL